MKKILFIVFTITLIGCKNQLKPDYAIVKGQIVNKEKGDLTIQTFDDKFKEIIDVSADGTFIDTLQIDQNFYVLYDGINPVFMYLEPGHDINIKYDAKDFKNSIIITGTGSEPTNYLLSKRGIEEKRFGVPQTTYTLSEADFKAKLESIMNAQDSLLNKSKIMSSQFITNEKKNLRYSYLNRLKDYEGAFKYFTKDNDFKVSDDFLNDIKTLDYNDENDFIFSKDYKSLVRDYYTDESKKIVERDSLAKDIAYLNTVSNIENNTIKNGLLFDYANFNMGYSKDTKAFYDLFLEHSTDEKNNEIIAKKYDKLTALAEGKLSPKFIDYENHVGGKMSLDDLKGKFVYIDVWATWCGPCIREIPALKEVEKKYHNKNIEFVSISIDTPNNHEKWKTMVNDKELSGIQLFADNDWNSTFVQEYQIQGIPKFILIDTEGNIVDSNAPRPSSEKLIELFNKHKI